MKSSRFPFWGLILGFVLSLILCSLLNENPIHILQVLIQSSFGSKYDLGLTLFYTTSLLFTGLSFSVASSAGLFNIGAEGQLTMAAIAVAALGFYFPELNIFMAVLLSTSTAILVGALWAFIPVYFLKKYKVHEVIGTMMLNFIATAISSYVVLNLISNPQSQNPESKPLPANYIFKSWDPFSNFFPDSLFNISFALAVFCALGLWYFERRTIWGFNLLSVGENPYAAARGGINVKKTQIIAMMVSGVFAGLVALNEVSGSIGQFKMDFSSDLGFVGIAVALVARKNPLGMIFSALLFAALHKGSMELDLETQNITRDFSKVLQAVIIMCVCFNSEIIRSKIIGVFIKKKVHGNS